MTDRRYGGFWRRFIAYLIDKIVLYLVSVFLMVVGSIALGHGGVSLGSLMATGELPRGMGLIAVVFAATMLITDMIYFTWFHGSVGQTPGKMLLGLRVIQASGERMTFGLAFLRWVGSLVSALFLWLGYLWIAVDWRKQGWHDKIAATLVVRAVNEPDERSSPDAAPQPSPDLPAAAKDSAAAGTAVPPLPPSASVAITGMLDGASAAPSPQAGRDAAGPAGGAPEDHPGQG
ncbi:MAG: RDD family protein [Syntrophales bacterium]